MFARALPLLLLLSAHRLVSLSFRVPHRSARSFESRLRSSPLAAARSDEQIKKNLELSALCQSRKVDAAVESLRNFQEADVVSFTTVIRALGRQGRRGEAFQLWRDMQRRGIRPNAHAYTAAIEMLAHNRDWATVQRYLDEMWRSGDAPNCHTYGALVRGYSKAGMWEDAMLVLDEMDRRGVKPNTVVINCVLHACAEAQPPQARAARDVYLRGIERYNMTADAWTFGPLIRAHGLSGDVRGAEEAFQEASDRRIASIVLYNQLAHAYSRNGRLYDALALLDDIKQSGLSADHFTYSTLVAACGRHNPPQVAEAERLVDECYDFVGFGKRSGVEVINALITCYAEAGLTQKAKDLLLSMRQRFGLRPRSGSYPAVMKALVEDNRPAEALALFDRLVEAEDRGGAGRRAEGRTENAPRGRAAIDLQCYTAALGAARAMADFKKASWILKYARAESLADILATNLVPYVVADAAFFLSEDAPASVEQGRMLDALEMLETLHELAAPKASPETAEGREASALFGELRLSAASGTRSSAAKVADAIMASKLIRAHRDFPLLVKRLCLNRAFAVACALTKAYVIALWPAGTVEGARRRPGQPRFVGESRVLRRLRPLRQAADEPQSASPGDAPSGGEEQGAQSVAQDDMDQRISEAMAGERSSPSYADREALHAAIRNTRAADGQGIASMDLRPKQELAQSLDGNRDEDGENAGDRLQEMGSPLIRASGPDPVDEQYPKRSHKSITATVNQLFRSLNVAGQPELGQSLFKELVEVGWTPDEETYKTLIFGTAGKAGGDHSRETVLSPASTALSLLSHMKKRGLKVNVMCYNGVISALVGAGMIREAWRFYGRMLDDGIVPSGSTYFCLAETVRSFSMPGGSAEERIGTPSEFDQLLKSLELTLDERAFEGLLAACVNRGLRDVAWRLLEERATMEQLRLNATLPLKVHNMAITVAPSFLEAGAAFAALRADGYKGDVYTFNSLLHSAAQSAKAMDENPGEVGLTPRLRGILSLMKKEGIRPDTVTFNVLIAACVRGRQDRAADLSSSGGSASQAALTLFQDMARRGIEPDGVTYGLLIRLLVQEGDDDSAMSLYYDMISRGHRPDLQAYELLLQGFARAVDAERAAWAYDEMRHWRIVPSAKAYRSLLLASVWSPNQARIYWDDYRVACKNTGVALDGDCVDAMVSILGENGHASEAAEVVLEAYGARDETVGTPSGWRSKPEESWKPSVMQACIKKALSWCMDDSSANEYVQPLLDLLHTVDLE